MDSITQIVLGAACGEAVLGKKIGNKALLFGAIGGTIPDLDVFIGRLLYNNEIDVMLFHRGFMHSILFSILGAFLFGWLVHKLYNTGKRQYSTTTQDWINLFFWSLLTHPILDCFTPYGTQLFAPFSNYRVAFNTIAVADPMYTLPFLICMLIVMFYKRQTNTRRLYLKLGFVLSSLYMLFTIGNKFYVDSVFKKTLNEKGITYQRFSTQPSILNNILWYGIAETETSYYVGFYSLLDSKNNFTDWEELPKERAIDISDYKNLKALSWFSNAYYNIIKNEDDTFSYQDLRYPIIKTEDKSSSVFNLTLFKDKNRLNMLPFEPDRGDFNKVMSTLWERLKGV